MSQNTDAKLVLSDEDHSGRDEMNLAGNPFALLQAASRAGQTSIHREWERQLPSGKIVNASWTVNGDAKRGLPGPQDELLYLVLLQISREQRDLTGEWPSIVHFSRFDVLNRLRWSNDSKSYLLLRECFFRLQAVSIQTIYSFHNPRTGAPVPTIAFNLIDTFTFNEEKTGPKNKNSALPFSWFKWSDTVQESLQAGNVRSLALDFTLSLETPISRRLFRLLELLRHARKPALNEVRLEVFSVRDRLGMTTYPYPSKIKEKLAPAIEELISRGYLASVDYEKLKRVEFAVFRFGSAYEPSHSPKAIKQERPKEVLLPSEPEAKIESSEESNIQVESRRAHAVFIALDEPEKNELLELARKEVSPIWHDRVGQPESPMSLGLWKLVAERYPEKLK